jgi:MarR family transcriptional regulator, organic hydroperoxide resistance regulator
MEYYALVAIETTSKDSRRSGRARTDPATEAWGLLQRIFAAERPHMIAVSRAYDLVPPHLFALQALERPMPMGELAKILVCDNSNVTWITDRLEERGLVERRPAEHDRRVKLLVLTPEGRQVREEIQDRLSTPPPAIERLSRKDQQTLSAILKRATAGLEAKLT